MESSAQITQLVVKQCRVTDAEVRQVGSIEGEWCQHALGGFLETSHPTGIARGKDLLHGSLSRCAYACEHWSPAQ